MLRVIRRQMESGSGGRDNRKDLAGMGPGPYRAVFAADVAEILLALPRARQRRALRLAAQIARNPFGQSDYSIIDSTGRSQEHVLLQDFVFVYWVDHAAREIRITDIEDAICRRATAWPGCDSRLGWKTFSTLAWAASQPASCAAVADCARTRIGRVERLRSSSQQSNGAGTAPRGRPRARPGRIRARGGSGCRGGRS